MGRWTAEYSDDVMTMKVKNIIIGAIKRSKLEGLGSTISYEAFAEELDEGDSFTTTLLEMLVKEITDRRKRQSAADRRLISERTAQSLRILATSSRVYHDRPAARHRSRINLMEQYASQEDWDADPTRPDLVDDDEIDDALSENNPGLEGARINSNLYDVYRPYNFARRGFPFISPPRSAGNRDVDRPSDGALQPEYHIGANIPRSSSNIGTSSGATSFARGSNATSLTRQPSIRRPTRSRTTDFNDFASRRRSSHRQHSLQESEHLMFDPLNADTLRRSPVQDELVSQGPPFADMTRDRPTGIAGGEVVDDELPLTESSNAGAPRAWPTPESSTRPTSLLSLSRNLRRSEPVLGRHVAPPRLRRALIFPITPSLVASFMGMKWTSVETLELGSILILAHLQKNRQSVYPPLDRCRRLQSRWNVRW
ncbi:hypothetical protein BD410DRAFT_35256 [Rickenella mellea]|uniref:Uncharacterized protein n=1 Tax=Rickenella mellea TaxID=50990 RepID=A0A4R5XFU9_9AGAM|nr:hypothetical protein BD410DRAFT_35256 [Rickenella mellea]